MRKGPSLAVSEGPAAGCGHLVSGARVDVGAGVRLAADAAPSALPSGTAARRPGRSRDGQQVLRAAVGLVVVTAAEVDLVDPAELVVPPTRHRHPARAADNQRSRRTAHFDPAPGATSDFLFRSRITCAHCQLRMWGATRRRSRYNLCQPAHQRGHIPADHPRTVYVNERALRDAVTGFLATAIYGPDRVAYWEQALTSTDDPDPAAPVRARITDLEQATAQLQARLRHQVLNLEDEALDAAARRPITQRITELEQELTEHETSARKLRGQVTAAAVPEVWSVRELLAVYPVNGDELRDQRDGDLRELFASLDLLVSYDHEQHRANVNVTLAAAQRDALLGSGLLRRHEADQNPGTASARLTAEIQLPPKGQRRR